MRREDSFSISDFAKLARTSRSTLIYYDRINLLSPLKRSKNGYRQYSVTQTATVNMIRTAQQLGFTLLEIKHIVAQRTPASMDDLLTQQINKIDKEINERIRARKLLSVLKQMIHTARNADTDAITVEHLPPQAIILGGLNNYSEGQSNYDELLRFYRDCSEKYPDIDLNYPAWGIISAARVQNGDWNWPDQYYFYNPDGLDRRPGGCFAIGYCNGAYGETDKLYRRLLSFIKTNGYEICGPAYEEYPLNELCVKEASNYLIRVMIMVRKM